MSGSTTRETPAVATVIPVSYRSETRPRTKDAGQEIEDSVLQSYRAAIEREVLVGSWRRTAGTDVDSRVSNVLECLERRVDLDVQALAASLRLSPSRLRHLFRAQMGLPIGRYILKRRLEVAANLLRTSYLSVKEVSEATRFKNASHFVREFHKSFGTPPREYRRSHASQRIAISEAK